MKALILLLVLAPTHKHHKKPTLPPTVLIDPLESPFPGAPCTMVDGLFQFDGQDGALGFSKDSCEAAYKVWQHTEPPKPRYLI